MIITNEPAVWVWGTNLDRLLIAPRKLPSTVFSTALSPSGSLLAVASADGNVTLWRMAVNGAQPLVFGVGSRLKGAAIDSLGDRVAVGDENGVVKIWDTRTGKRSGPSFEHGTASFHVSFSPDGSRIVTGGERDVFAKVWDSNDRTKPLRQFRSSGYVARAGFSADGSKLFVIGGGMSARIWNVETGQPLTDYFGKDTHFGAFNTDGSRLATEADSEVVKSWNASRAGVCAGEARHKAVIHDVKASRDGRYFSTASLDSTARVWTFDPVQPASPPLTHKGGVTSTEFSRDGELLATASLDHTAQVWRWRSGNPVGEPLSHRAEVKDARFSPDGTRVATAAADHTVRLWQTATGRPISVPLDAWLPLKLTWTADGARLFVSDRAGPCLLDLPSAPASAPLWLADWAEAVGGERVDADGRLQPVGFKELAEFQKSVDQLPGDDVYTRTARWFFASGSSRPISPDSLVSRDAFIGQLCRTASALTLQTLTQLAPEDIRPRARALVLAVKAGEVDPARLEEAIQTAKKDAPQDMNVWLAESLLLEKREQSEAALAAAQRAAQLAPEDFEPLSQLAGLFARQGQDLEACDTLTKAINAARDDPDQRRPMLARRSALLVKLGRVLEASADACAARGIAGRSSDAAAKQIDLSLHYNIAFDQGMGPTPELDIVPQGLQTMAGVVFDVRGCVQLSGHQTVNRLSSRFPDEMVGIRVAQKCQRLHFLHATRDTEDGKTRVVAHYVVHYDDGTSEDVPVTYNRDLSGSNRFDPWPESLAPGGDLSRGPLVLAWSSETDAFGKIGRVFLFKKTWQNPHPEKVVKSLDFVSTKAATAPFLVAITVE